MQRDPCLRFLGVPSSGSPHELLGVEAVERSPSVIQEALKNRLDRIYRHPSGRSVEAEVARRILRDAAKALRSAPLPSVSAEAVRSAAAPSGRPRTSSRVADGHRMTAFDRAVLTVLVAHGGWNRRSRMLLSSLAAAHGVSVEGLVRVLRGLDSYARSGGPVIRVGDIASVSPGPRSAEVDLVERIGEVTRRVLPELAARESWSLTKLSTLVVLLVGLFSLVMYRAMVGPAELPYLAGDSGLHGAAHEPADAVDVGAPAGSVQVVPFRSYPTFRGNAIPIDGSALADRAGRLEADLDAIERRLASGDRPDDVMLATWQESIDVLSVGWALLTEGQSREHRRRLVRILSETSGRPDASRMLMSALIPPPRSFLTREDLWRGAWICGMLADISAGGASPFLVELARGQFAASLGRLAVPVLQDFSDGARLWLAEAAVRMLDRIEIDDAFEDGWETWLAVQQRVGPRTRGQDAVLVVIERILAGTSDLTRTGPTTRLLGRLLMETDFSGDLQVRDALVSWFDDRSRITDADLWVLGSLLVQGDAVPWLDRSFVLVPGQPVTARARIRDRLSVAWPSAGAAPLRGQATPPNVPPGLLQEWIRQLNVSGLEADEEWAGAPRTVRLGQITRLMAMNAAAEGMLRGDAPGTERMIQIGGATIESADRRSASSARGAAHAGVPGDGAWARRYRAARGMEERAQALDELDSNQWRDLGPEDASLFAELLLRGPAAIRGGARRIFVGRFSASPGVVQSILDHFHLVRPGDEDLRDLIAQATATHAPYAGSDDAYVLMRRALVNHLVALLDPEVPELDQIGQVMSEIIVYHTAMTEGSRTLELGLVDVVDAITRLGEAQVRRMERRATGVMFSESLPAIRRSRSARLTLAQAPLEAIAADQITVLQCSAIEASQARPHRVKQVDAVLDESVRARQQARDLLSQMRATQIALLRIMEIRLAVDPDTVAERGEERQ